MSLTSFSPELLRVPVACLMSHSSVVTDEPATLSYQITLFGTVDADVRQSK